MAECERLGRICVYWNILSAGAGENRGNFEFFANST